MPTPTPTPTPLPSALLRAADDFLERQPRWLVLALSLVLVALVGALDWQTGAEIGLSILYVLPISLGAWHGGRGVGLVVSLAAAGAWLAADTVAFHSYSQAWIPAWNAGIRLSFFVLTTLLLTRVRRDLQEHERLSRIDPVTGIANGRVLLRELDRVVREAGGAAREGAGRRRAGARDGDAGGRRRGDAVAATFTLGYLDLDDFKRVNDRRGHLEGDRLLRTVATTLDELVRPRGLVARVGGDEFAVLLPRCSSEEAAALLADARSGLDARLAASSEHVGFSLGAVTFTAVPSGIDPAEAADAALRRVDDLMYRAKAAGKNLTIHEVDDAVGQREASGPPAGRPPVPRSPSSALDGRAQARVKDS